MFKGWIDKLTKKKQDDANPAANENANAENMSPEAVKKRKREEAEKKFKRMADAMKIANKGAEIYKTTAEKLGEAADRVVETTKDIADKAKPVTDIAKGALGGAFETAKDKIADGTKAAGEKMDEIRKDNEKKPSTGSSLLDFLTPAVPETDATKPKAKKEDTPKPPEA